MSSESESRSLPETVLPAIDMVQQQSENRRQAEATLRSYEDGGNTQRATGALLVAASVGITGTVVSGVGDNLRFDNAMPFIQSLQDFISGVDGSLAIVGGIVLPVALCIEGVVKLGAGTRLGGRYKGKLATIEDWSSSELNNEKKSSQHASVRLGQTVLKRVVAGRIPVVASAGVFLAAFSTSIGTEVSEGPQRPIEAALTSLTPGDTLITGFDGAMPMVESRITQDLGSRITETATAMGVKTHILDLDLGTIDKDGQTLTNLALATNLPPTSNLSFNYARDCGKKPIPVGVDSTAGMKVGDELKISGFDAQVAQIVEKFSASNRVGVVEDEAAMKCMKKSELGPVHAVVVDAPLEVGQAILAQANTRGEVAAVITKDRYLQNSKNFWVSNSKPITSVLSLFAGLVSVVAMRSSMRENMVRSRRNWAQKSARKMSDGMIRGTEAMRALKNGIAATFFGSLIAVPTTAVVLNTLESGFQAGVGLKELGVGAAVGIGGSIIGAIKSIIKPQNIIDTARNTN
ncbi:hypothetical protein H7171_00655 [Candidatus Saccharibacteria bacterium]|nr:hypothetical protein [Candidatus Saccharibacteria bacterium]